LDVNFVYQAEARELQVDQVAYRSDEKASFAPHGLRIRHDGEIRRVNLISDREETPGEAVR